MKNGLRPILQVIGIALSIAFGVVVTAQTENRERYIISAKAGGINFVSGNVTVQRRRSTRQKELTSTDDLATGDRVNTGAGGRVEVLLNPGTYMRVDENSEFELANASLDDLLVKLVKGSAVVEVSGADGVKLAIGFNTPQTEALIVKGGIYRFNVLPNETTEILVRKGKVLYGRGASNELKSGKKLLIGRGVLEVAKLEKKDQDSLDIWSKDRAQLLARANRKLQNRSLLTAFNDYGGNNWGPWRSYSSYDSMGFWVFNSAIRSYCFLPYGWRAGSSPYGHSYGTGIGYTGSGNGWSGGGGGGGVTGGNGGPTVGNGGSGSGGGNGGGPGPAPAPQPISPPSPSPAPSIQSERVPRQDYRTNN